MKKVLLLLLITASISGCSTTKYKLSDFYDFTFFESESVRIEKARDLQTGMFKFSKDGKSLFFMESHLIEEKSLLLSNHYRIDSLMYCNLETGRLNSIISADELSGTRIGRFTISKNGRYTAFSIFDNNIFLGLYYTDILENKTTLLDGETFKSPSVFFFSPDESALIVNSSDSRLVSWNLNEESITANLKLNKKYGILEISDDSEFFGAILEDNSGKLINSSTLNADLDIAEYSNLISSWDPKSLTISPNNSLIAFTGRQKNSQNTSIYLRDLATENLNIISSTDKKNPFLKFSYNGKFLILIDGTGEWEIVNTATGENNRQRDSISKIIFSGNSNYILAIEKNQRSVRRIDLERSDQTSGRLQLDKDIIHAELINDNRGILAVTEREILFHDLGSDQITKTISHRDRQFAIHPENNTLCYADKNGFALMNLLFNIEIADYVLLDQNDYIFKPAGNGYIISEELANSFPSSKDDLFFVGKKIDLTRPVLPPVISIKDITLTKPFIRAGEDLELEITVINSGPGDSGNLRMEIESDTNLNISGDTIFPVVDAMGGMQNIKIIIKSGKMTNLGRTSLSLRLFEEDFGIQIQGKRIDFQIIGEPKPEVILAKHNAVEYSSTNNNSIIDLNEIIDVTFYIQNIGRADSNISAYSIECSQQGVKLLGYVDSAKEITDKPIIENLASGDYFRIEQRYFINSFFKDRNLNFQLSVDDEKTNLLTDSLSLPVNKKLTEQGQIRTVRADPQPETATISIKNIEEPVTAVSSSGTEDSMEIQYLTVFDFSSNEQADSEVRYITSLVTETVNKSRLFKLIDSEERDRLLKELNFSLSAVSIEENTLEVGRMVPANYMILGTIDKVENSYLVTMKIIKTETGELISSRQSLIRSFGEIPEVIPQITLELIHF